jgi:ABC-type antimicrobial peptide transport system permease subunit
MLALLLAVAGLYGVTSYTMSRRTAEIGLRMALGADRGAVVRMVIREALTLVVVGLAIGIPAGLAVARLTASRLADVSATDPTIVGAAVVLMLVGSLCAAAIPAVRASRVDPVKALRQE